MAETAGEDDLPGTSGSSNPSSSATPDSGEKRRNHGEAGEKDADEMEKAADEAENDGSAPPPASAAAGGIPHGCGFLLGRGAALLRLFLGGAMSPGFCCLALRRG